MLIRFRVQYHALWGEKLQITGSLAGLGDSDCSRAADMESVSEDMWERDVFVETAQEIRFTYRYLIRNDRGAVSVEEGTDRQVSLAVGRAVVGGWAGRLVMEDTWQNPSDPDSLLLSSAFTKVIFRRNLVPKNPSDDERQWQHSTPMMVRLQLIAPRVGKNDTICVVGSIPELGNWDPAMAITMDDSRFPLWKADLYLDEPKAFAYKYVIKDSLGNLPFWEEGDNRNLRPEADTCVIKTDNNLRYRNQWKGAGVAVPVFSLRSNKGLGVGEFLDLKLLADWAAMSGLRVVQILPVNDTTTGAGWPSFYPYSCTSVFALHPVYLNLEAIGDLPAKIREKIDSQRRMLNDYGRLAYEKVMALKMPLLRELYRIKKEAFLGSKEFRAFFEKNGYWVKSFAAFCALRDREGTNDFTKWKRWGRASKTEVDALVSPDSEYFDDVGFCYFLQYHLHSQLLEASEYARAKGVVLKGDIPIGVQAHSHDCWAAPELFNMEKSAGAPPDPFSDAGQNWSFPTYDWEAMARDNYSWWRNRLSQMAAYFEMVRLDHVLGFFRIWEIPGRSFSSLLGRFNPVIPLWKDEFERQGVADFRRLCDPYITLPLLHDIFGKEAAEVAETFLEEYAAGFFCLKQGFGTQAQVNSALATPPGSRKELFERNERIKNGLFQLITNVILLRDQNPTGYHFRINMMHTASFASLDAPIQDRLVDLYNDYFYHRQEELWRVQGMIKLSMLKTASDMLVCGEDLGMIPDCVPRAMEELCVLGLRIQRWPKGGEQEFGCPRDYSYLTVCTTSSHDTSTIRGWWEEDRERAERYYKTVLNKDGETPPTCTPEVCRRIIEDELNSPSMWAIFPIQDLLGMSDSLRSCDPEAERINDPANPYHQWNYRLHVPLERLIEDEAFSSTLKSMIAESGRGQDY